MDALVGAESGGTHAQGPRANSRGLVARSLVQQIEISQHCVAALARAAAK